ncbi:MAG: hypothetical protein WCT22_02785 [Patescibacteria group bacterium]
MFEAFPRTQVTFSGEDEPNKTDQFNVAIPKIDEIEALATELFGRRITETDKATALKEYDCAVGPAVQLLAVVVTHCNSCPVKKRGVCTGMKEINFKVTPHYQAKLSVSSVGDVSPNNATNQLSNAKCGITASQLNQLHQIKVG